MICIIDYNMGNLFSIQKKMVQLGVEVIVSDDIEVIQKAEKLILPGIGHFGKAMDQLDKKGLTKILNEEVIEKKKPILGICLGMQLMTKFSEEGNVDGLAWFDADVRKFQIQNTIVNKVPHTGWNQISIQKESKLLKNIPDGSEFYFVHSYYVKSNTISEQLTSTTHEESFTSAIEKDNIFGVQFHPEKSHQFGFQMIKNFVEL